MLTLIEMVVLGYIIYKLMFKLGMKLVNWLEKETKN